MLEPLPVDVKNDYLDVLTAFGTVGATVLAVIAIWMQLSDRRRTAEDLRRAQASKIAAWVEEVEPGEQGRYRSHRKKLVTRNGSDEPVYDVTVRSTAVGGQRKIWIGSIPPQMTIDQPGDDTVGDPGTITFQLHFRDAAGTEWTRDVDGELRRRRAVGPSTSRAAGVAAPKYRLY